MKSVVAQHAEELRDERAEKKEEEKLRECGTQWTASSVRDALHLLSTER